MRIRTTTIVIRRLVNTLRYVIWLFKSQIVAPPHNLLQRHGGDPQVALAAHLDVGPHLGARTGVRSTDGPTDRGCHSSRRAGAPAGMPLPHHGRGGRPYCTSPAVSAARDRGQPPSGVGGAVNPLASAAAAKTPMADCGGVRTRTPAASITSSRSVVSYALKRILRTPSTR